MTSWREKVRSLKREVTALALCCRHPRTPWYARLVVIAVVGYAVSPLDLIPDFIPVLGLLDDLVLVPMGLALAIRLVPPDVLEECRAQAADLERPGPNWLVGGIIVAIWVLTIAALVVWWLRRHPGPG